MKFILKKTPERIFWADIFRLEMETEDGRRILCILQTKSRRKNLFCWKSSHSLKYSWKDGGKPIEDEKIIQALDEILHSNLIKELKTDDAKGKIFDSEEESRIFKI